MKMSDSPIEQIKELVSQARIEKHNKPEISGAYFLAGGHGKTDENLLLQFVRIVPVYGCPWEQVYEKTDRSITYEGS